jgi:hypothetical protein
MIGTNLQRKRSDRGASLLLLVSIIGLAFIVTVAALLAAASYSQDRARLASAKVDVANREDVLMREILRETAKGLAPGTDTNGVTAAPASWTSIMSTAATNLHAISYVDQVELQALGITGNGKVTTANLGDNTGGTLLGIFQGYNQEVPFGGTSGLANSVPNLAVDYNGNVIDPPLMNWSGNTTLSLATAATTPQEFFLGSLYTAADPAGVTGPAKLSISNRWGQIFYPAIRFGYKQPNYDPSGKPIPGFVARRVWWRIPVAYQAAQPNAEYQAGTVGAPSANSFPSAPANYILSVYEIPSQLPISGNANLQIGLNDDGTAWGSGIKFTGSIYGGQVQLADPTSSGRTYNSVSSPQQVNVVNPATVGGVPYSDSTFDQPGRREQMALTQTPGAAAPVSVAGNDGKVLLVPVMPGNNFYMQAPGNAPTHWDLYARPYYKCRIRVIISGTDPTIISTPNPVPNQAPIINPAAGAIKVTIYYLPDTATPPQPDQILGFPDSAATNNKTFTQTSIAAGGLPPYMNYTSTATGDRNILIINIPLMVQDLGNPAQLYSIYIGDPPNPPDSSSPPYNYPGIAITNTHDLTTIIDSKGNPQPFLFSSGLSILTNQTLYLLDAFNQVIPVGATTPPPTSIYAPQIRYGLSGINSQVNSQINTQASLTGQVAVVATPAPSPSPAVNPLRFNSSDGNSFPSSNIKATLNEVLDPTPWSTTSPTGLPPITALSLLFTIEKEHTN